MARPLVPILILACCLLASGVALLRTDLPAPVALGLGLAALLLLGASPRLGGPARVVAVNLGLIALVLLGFELALRFETRAPEEVFSGTYANGYWERRHPVLGYRPVPGRVSTSTKHQAGETIYSVTYTIGDDALRLSPPHRDDAASSIVCFGGSYMFGEGVEDDETTPYRLGVLSGGACAVYNLGLHGYGPHHMLAALESGYASARIAVPPACVVFITGVHHDARVSGAPWDVDGPRYVLRDGALVRDGTFREHRDLRRRLRDRFGTRAGRSGILRAVFDRLLPAYRSNPDLYVAVVDSARAVSERIFPGATFHVLFWDDSELADRYIAALTLRGIRVHRVSDALPGLPEDRARYQLSPLDGHPTPAAHDLIARYILDEIIGAAR